MSVYYVHAPQVGLVKIGYAEDPVRRFCKIQSDSPVDLALLAVEVGGKDIEEARHRQFSSLRVRGEWFQCEGPLSAHIDTLPPHTQTSRRKDLAGPLGEWIRRNEHTLESFAALTETTAATISRVCLGRVIPRKELMLRICAATNHEVDANAFFAVPKKEAA